MVQLLKHPIVLLLCGIAIVVFYFSLDKTAEKRHQSSEMISQLQQEVENESKIITAMEQEKIDSETLFAQDKIIHDELLQKAEGEFVVMIADLPEVEPDVQLAAEATTPWEEWKQLIF